MHEMVLFFSSIFFGRYIRPNFILKRGKKKALLGIYPSASTRTHRRVIKKRTQRTPKSNKKEVQMVKSCANLEHHTYMTHHIWKDSIDG